MGGYRLSARALSRLDDIYLTSFEKFGEAQASRYLLAIGGMMEQLALHPGMGRSYGRHPTLDVRCKGVGSHMIYYLIEGSDIAVLDILHQAMLPERHLTDGDD